MHKNSSTMITESVTIAMFQKSERKLVHKL